MKLSITLILLLAFTTNALAQKTYAFRRSAQAKCCGYMFFQKVSWNRRYELLINLKIDSLPLLTEFDIEKYAPFVTIQLNIYPRNNPYIHPICNDLVLGRSKTPVKYNGIKGYITINFWDKKNEVISLTLRGGLVTNGAGNTVWLPKENFNNLSIGWIGE